MNKPCTYLRHLTKLHRRPVATPLSIKFRSKSTAVNPRDEISKDEDTGYMKRRLAQLAEESRPFKDDPKAGKMYFEGEDDVPVADVTNQQLIDRLVEKIGDLESTTYKAKYQREIAQATKIPSYASAGARDIAMAQPWTGTETTVNAANRMLQDVYKPMASSNVTPPSSLRPKLSVSQRLATARDHSLDYEIKHKASLTEEAEETGPTFKELYADRFVGHSAMVSDFTAIGSLASQRIEDAISRGEFKNLPGRGQKTEKDHNLSSPYIDHTEYYLNNMIKRQGAAPIWIDRQGGLNTKLAQLRSNLEASWLRHIVHSITQDHATLSTPRKLAIARDIQASNGVGGFCHSWNKSWQAKHLKYHTLLLESINSSIRSYNLQAPAAARRGYIMLDKELSSCFTESSQRLVKELESFLLPKPNSSTTSSSKSNMSWSSVAGGSHSSSSYSQPSPSMFSKEMIEQTHEPFVIKEKGVLKNLFKTLWTVQDIK